MKKIISLSTAFLFILSTTFVGIHADNNDRALELSFENFSYTENTIDSNEVYTEYSFANGVETYIVKEINSNETLEIISVEEIVPLTRASGVHTALFTVDTSYGSAATVRLTISVQYYSNGSFRSFEGYNYANLALTTSVTSMEIANASAYATSQSGSYPCTQMNYSYSGNLRTNGSVSASASSVLFSAGFSYSTYYNKYISKTGNINLYN